MLLVTRFGAVGSVFFLWRCCLLAVQAVAPPLDGTAGTLALLAMRARLACSGAWLPSCGRSYRMLLLARSGLGYLDCAMLSCHLRAPWCRLSLLCWLARLGPWPVGLVALFGSLLPWLSWTRLYLLPRPGSWTSIVCTPGSGASSRTGPATCRSHPACLRLQLMQDHRPWWPRFLWFALVTLPFAESSSSACSIGT